MDENRAGVRLHADTGPLLAQFGSAGVEVEFASTRDGRWRDFFRSVGRRSDLTYEQIMSRLEEDEVLRDMVHRALIRTLGESDSHFRDALAELVGAAFDEGTDIEETDHLVREVQKLEPVHLRVLRACFRPGTGTEDDFNRTSRYTTDEHDGVSFEEAELLVARPVEMDWIRDRVNVSDPLIYAALGVLIGAGLIVEVPENVEAAVNRVAGFGGASHPPQWVAMQWAGRVMEVLYPGAAVSVSPPRQR